jgi:MFS transporter, putative metabolite:H+ symporter
MKAMMNQDRKVLLVVLVAALGYFVDIYDLVLFSIIRIQSLKSLGIEGQALEENGVFILNMQMAGMLIGGIFWGILGDKKGRLSVLFGSILMYSLANIANAYVTDVTSYGIIRFIAGVGLAGELGAGITLVSEMMSKETRGHGTMIVVTIGAAGAIFAGLLSKLVTWQTAYLIGGGLGIALLLLRIGVTESGMFNTVKEKSVSRGDFLMLFTDKQRFFTFLHSILIGVPIWFAVGILITFSPEISRELGIEGEVVTSTAVMAAYAGLTLGDFISGLLSQLLRTRKKVVFVFILFTMLTVILMLYSGITDLSIFYYFCFQIGLASGYWAVFVTMASENFGTNIRATVTTSVPNFVRGAVVPITLGYSYLQSYGHMSKVNSAMTIGVICIGIALFSLSKLRETWGRELDYEEV